MSPLVILISNAPNSAWVNTVREAVQVLGEIQVVAEAAAHTLDSASSGALIMIDATGIKDDAVGLVEQLHRQWPQAPIVVATTSPTWNRARQVFLAGAADYIRKSFDKATVVAAIREVLERFSPQQVGFESAKR